MLEWLSINPRGRPRLRVLTLAFLAAVIVFSGWFFWSFWGTVHLWDDLIARKYEGSLSGNLGFLVVLTSEASRELNFKTPAEQARTARIRAVLARTGARLEHLGIEPPQATPLPPLTTSLEAVPDEDTLLRLLTDPQLATLSLSALDLEVGSQEDLPTYPFLQTAALGVKASSFVFIPAPLVDTEGGVTPDVPLRVRRELVFSRIAANDIRNMLTALKAEKIYQAYYISCSDFVRITNAEFGDQRFGYRDEFSPLRSFADRTYFRETRSSLDHFRQSEPYIDVTGGGLINTYSVYFENDSFGVCGMIAADRRLQTLQSFWDEIDLGATSGNLRDFSVGTYSIAARELQPTRRFSADFRQALRDTIEARLSGVKSEIQRFEIANTTVFTVPKGERKLACFVFDPMRTRRKYLLIFTGGLVSIVSFVGLVWLDSRMHRDVEAAQQFQTEIVENLNGGFVVVDSKDIILSANDRFLSLVGKSAISKIITDYLAPESVTEYSELRPRGGFEFAGRVRSSDGSFIPEIITSAPLSHRGKRDRRMFIFIHSADLEQTIARKFLNIFSHALKSPVHSLLLIADLFRRKNALPKFDYYYSQMQRKVQEFKTLTNNVLLFSALDVKELSPELRPVNVAKILRHVLGAARERAKAQELELHDEIPDDLRAVADEGLLQVVFNNLIDNALKYTPQGGITIRANDTMTRIWVAVEDTGPGVSDRERENIFDLFVQGSRPGATSREGLGLGLYISKKYVEAMKGSLKYEPIFDEKRKPGEAERLAGSRFVVELPKTEGG